MPKSDRSHSKWMSLVLRHDPGVAGVTLDAGGWVDVDALLTAAPDGLDRDALTRIVAQSDKQRFALNPDGTRIRANQGHSVTVDLGLEPRVPPEVLYHGTADKNVPAIMTEGLRPMSRQHVHLSPDTETAHKVGTRHGKPVILTVAAGKMHAAGHVFWLSENGVWLTDHVPAEYVTIA
ncbi:RNA 2'-phosphotransferase [Pseudaestuariivita rosea]|uniref:RNA 2'-phosphotransferase n=1 Tax=Pseudaestuariivita rosea TaxID=2763263 RepID=UPI001ABBCC18|nr:RNA 2'-phosphotransferase [Pseudaestuariivita rosea]